MRMRLARMKKLIKTIFIFFIVLFSFQNLRAQEVQRGFDQTELSQYQADPDFQYEVVKAEPETAFEKFIKRIRDWFFGLFESQASRNVLDILFKLLLFTAFVYFIIKIFGIEVNTVFKPSAKKELNFFDVKEESLDRINFESEIETALLQKQYRVAIRLMYLNALYKASKAGLIDLRQGKTNREYAYELSGNSAESEFNELGYLFDYTWYGHFEADERLSGQAKQFLKSIEQKWANER